MNPFQNKTKKPALPDSQTAVMLRSTLSQLNKNSSLLSSQVARGAFALESLDDETVLAMDQAADGLNTALEHIFQEAGFKATPQQKQSAMIAGMMGGDVNAYLGHAVSLEGYTAKNTDVVIIGAADAIAQRPAMEAYDEKELKNSIAYSVAYNMNSPRQDAFGEAFFPTVVVNPDQVGYQISIRLTYVYPEVRRNIDGSVNDFKKRNIIQAIVDPSILKTEQLKVVPVYRDESKANFVDAALLAPKNITFEGETITTSALKFDNKFSLLGISQTPALLETGVMDSTDALDAAITLQNVYMSVAGKVANVDTTEVFKFMTANMPLSNFIAMQQDDYRMMQVTFMTEGLLVTGNTKTVGGATSGVLAAIAANKVSVRLELTVNGTVNVELGTTNLMASKVRVKSVTDEDGNLLSLTAPGIGKDIADLFATAEAIGYDLAAQRTNSNRRQRGTLLGQTIQNQVYNVPLRSPITIPRPQMVGDQNDASDLAALISTTRIRISNAAVDKLLETADQLKELVAQNDLLENNLPILGIARHLVTAFYDEFTVDVQAQMNNLTSNEKYDDIGATLINQLRDLVYRMLVKSAYQAAADALAGGIAPMPDVIIGTDPKTARYLMVSGDLRTLGTEVNIKLVTTLNLQMRDTIIVAFGQPNAGDGTPNPLHYGNMVWKPEMTLIMPTQRNGSNSKEITVTPSFNHIVNVPIMARIYVKGITEAVVNKSVIAMQDVTP